MRCGAACEGHGGSVRNGPLQPYGNPNKTCVALAACALTTTGSDDGSDDPLGPYVVGTKTSNDPDAPCFLPSLNRTLPSGRYSCCCLSA